MNNLVKDLAVVDLNTHRVFVENGSIVTEKKSGFFGWFFRLEWLRGRPSERRIANVFKAIASEIEQAQKVWTLENLDGIAAETWKKFKNNIYLMSRKAQKRDDSVTELANRTINFLSSVALKTYSQEKSGS